MPLVVAEIPGAPCSFLMHAGNVETRRAEPADSIENIQKTVADYYKIRISDMHSKKRSRAVARPRQVAMALAKELTQLSLPEIGSNFGGRDHTTVLHACRQIAKLREAASRHQPRRQFPAAGAAQLGRRATGCLAARRPRPFAARFAARRARPRFPDARAPRGKRGSGV